MQKISSRPALAKAAEKRFDFREEAPLRAWLFRIARNVAVDHLREYGKICREFTEETYIPESAAETTPLQEQRLERGQMNRCIDEVLRGLPLDYQEILALSDMEELPDKESAAILGITAGAAKIPAASRTCSPKNRLGKGLLFLSRQR